MSFSRTYETTVVSMAAVALLRAAFYSGLHSCTKLRNSKAPLNRGTDSSAHGNSAKKPYAPPVKISFSGQIGVERHDHG